MREFEFTVRVTVTDEDPDDLLSDAQMLRDARENLAYFVDYSDTSDRYGLWRYRVVGRGAVRTGIEGNRQSRARARTTQEDA